MNRDEFQNTPVGHLVPTMDQHWAFVPAPLPRELVLPTDVILLLDEASRAVSVLAGVGETLTNPHLLIRPFLRREAVLSSQIEGTQASVSEIYRFEASEGKAFRRRVPGGRDDAREIRNYERAVEHGQVLLEKLPISARLINEMHGILLMGVRGGDKRLGEWRTEQVWIGAEGTRIEDARFVPPPASEMAQLMTDWEKFVNESTALPPLIECALMHYQFETIHPYSDGNGRIGRSLITLFLIERKILSAPLLYLSVYFERNRLAYYDHLLSLSRTGDWMPWLRYFLVGVREQARDAVIRSRRLRSMQDEYRQTLRARSESGNALRLLEHIFDRPYQTAQSASAFLGVTEAGARNILNRLVDAGVLVKINTHPRFYVAREMLHVVEAPAADSAE